jgi:hypothetical protein
MAVPIDSALLWRTWSELLRKEKEMGGGIEADSVVVSVKN